VSQSEEKKDLTLGYGLWCLSLIGLCGVQRLYIGQVGYGLVLMFTFGLCGIAQLLDLILLPDVVAKANDSKGVRDSSPMPVPPMVIPPADNLSRAVSSSQSSSAVEITTHALDGSWSVRRSRQPSQDNILANETSFTENDQELDTLLREARLSVERTNTIENS